MWSSASGGMPVGEGGEEQWCEDVPHVFQGERRPGIDVDPTACRADGCDEVAEHAHGVGVDGAPRVVGPHRDPEIGEFDRPARREVEAPRRGVPAVGAGEHSEFEFEIVDGPRHRAGDGDVGLLSEPGGPGI